MVQTCDSANQPEIEQSSFWDSNGVNWDHHRIGWAIAGGSTVITVIITLINVFRHCRNYRNPVEQRQILRILYMPLVYGVISFFSYRFFRSYTYYSLIEVAYESVTLSAFLLLLIAYVAKTASENKAENAMLRKDKTSLPFPFGYWHYRPTKPYFMYTLKWSVLQYVIIRPLISIIGMICEHFGVLGASCSYSIHFAEVYLEAVDFISISFALYGLIVFYGLTKEELIGKKPLSKFLSIKLIVMFTFYQSFIFSTLVSHGVIHQTQYWTANNVADGLNALAICIEMIFFSGWMMFAFNASEYHIPGEKATSVFRPLWDSINYADFAHEILGSFKFFFDYARKKPHTRGPRLPVGPEGKRVDFGQAFGVEGSDNIRNTPPVSSRSYGEQIALAQYTTPPGSAASPPTGTYGRSGPQLANAYQNGGSVYAHQAPYGSQGQAAGQNYNQGHHYADGQPRMSDGSSTSSPRRNEVQTVPPFR